MDVATGCPPFWRNTPAWESFTDAVDRGTALRLGSSCTSRCGQPEGPGRRVDPTGRSLPATPRNPLRNAPWKQHGRNFAERSDWVVGRLHLQHGRLSGLGYRQRRPHLVPQPPFLPQHLHQRATRLTPAPPPHQQNPWLWEIVRCATAPPVIARTDSPVGETPPVEISDTDRERSRASSPDGFFWRNRVFRQKNPSGQPFTQKPTATP